MRHDWNSLLDSDVAPMTQRSEVRFPPADTLVDYLRDFAEEQVRAPDNMDYPPTKWP